MLVFQIHAFADNFDDGFNEFSISVNRSYLAFVRSFQWRDLLRVVESISIDKLVRDQFLIIRYYFHCQSIRHE